MNNEKVNIQLLSGYNVEMSTALYDDYFSTFTESQYFSFNNFINSGFYFPQIMQFISVLITILNGKTRWSDIIICNIISGIAFTLIWFFCRLYKVPGLSFICCLIGGNIFRFFLHFIPIAIIAFFVIKDWKVLLFCAIGGFITAILKAILFPRLSNIKYHNEIVNYVAKFKYKQ